MISSVIIVIGARLRVRVNIDGSTLTDILVHNNCRCFFQDCLPLNDLLSLLVLSLLGPCCSLQLFVVVIIDCCCDIPSGIPIFISVNISTSFVIFIFISFNQLKIFKSINFALSIFSQLFLPILQIVKILNFIKIE